jgi:hypothetical protein
MRTEGIQMVKNILGGIAFAAIMYALLVVIMIAG